MSLVLRNSMKGFINIKSNNNKCFLWCHTRHLNPLKIHPKRIKKSMVNDLDYESNELLDSKKDFGRIEKENKFALMCFLMKIIWFILFIYQIKKLKDSIELLMIKNKNKSHYVCTKDFNRFICNKTR